MRTTRLLVTLALVGSGLSFGACGSNSPPSSPGAGTGPSTIPGKPSGGVMSGGGVAPSGGSGYGGHGGSGYGGSGYGGYGGSGYGGSSYGGYGGSGSGYGGYGGSGSGYGGSGYGGYGGSGSGEEATVPCGSVECATSAFYCLQEPQSGMPAACAFYPPRCAHAPTCACLLATQPSCMCSDLGNGGLVLLCGTLLDE